MHPRTKQDLQAIRPLGFAPMQKFVGSAGDTAEISEDAYRRIRLQDLAPEDRPLVCTGPDMLTDPPGPQAPPAEQPDWLGTLCSVLAVLLMLALAFLAGYRLTH